MKIPSHAEAFQVLCLRACDGGRKEVLFGESADRALRETPPFMVGPEFPTAYLEFPLVGDPFMDVTVVYNGMSEGTRIASNMAAGTDRMLDWYARAREDCDDINFGFELDTKSPEASAAAIHFQPRDYTELVEPFCAVMGEPERARLYLDFARRMGNRWPPSYFGMFRGRPDSPLRVCGYLEGDERTACIEDPGYLPETFARAGFSAYDDAMLSELRTFMTVAPESMDYQFDVRADGSLSGVFAMEAQFETRQPEAVRAWFESGPGVRLMGLLQEWGVADERWKKGIDATFACKLPVELDDGSPGSYALTLVPQWLKLRWIDGVLQPAKLYYLAGAGLL